MTGALAALWLALVPLLGSKATATAAPERSTCSACHALRAPSSKLARVMRVDETRLVVANPHRIPAFARQYRTSCSTCHTAAPKLNVLGEAFRLNGYRLPENAKLLRKESTVSLGEPEWRELWPRGIWPGELPATAPIAIRTEMDISRRSGPTPLRWEWELPHEVYLLAGANFGGSLSSFTEVVWSGAEGFRVAQAKAMFQDVLPGAPSRVVNLWIGLQNASLFSFADRQTDGVGRNAFLWQIFSFAATRPAAGPGAPSPAHFTLGGTRPAIEVNGLPRPWAFYALGVSSQREQHQPGGAGAGATALATTTAGYYKLRAKIGGLRLDGTYRAGGVPPAQGHGQLLDRSLVLEHFANFGTSDFEGQRVRHSATGAAARLYWSRIDAGAAYLISSARDPWPGLTGRAINKTVFGKAEYLVFPWLMPYVRAESSRLRLPANGSGWTTEMVLPPRDRVLPGVSVLIRQNVRAVLEGEIAPERSLLPGVAAVRRSPLAMRLDLAF